MLLGLVFDIREFTIHDGPGVRVTIFMKGCPLRCSWCHNPEGQTMSIQTMIGPLGERTLGQWFTPEELAARLNKHASFLRTMHGGVTFSGGEPIMQSDFVAETMDLLVNLHITLDTSGSGPRSKFLPLVKRSQLVLYDIKLVNERQHKKFTRFGNKEILENLWALSDSGIPFYIRVPLIPGITDTQSNLKSVVNLVKDLPGMLGVDLLPYNKLAGGKYASLGMNFNPGFEESRETNITLNPFHEAGIRAKII